MRSLCSVQRHEWPRSGSTWLTKPLKSQASTCVPAVVFLFLPVHSGLGKCAWTHAARDKMPSNPLTSEPSRSRCSNCPSQPSQLSEAQSHPSRSPELSDGAHVYFLLWWLLLLTTALCAAHHWHELFKEDAADQTVPAAVNIPYLFRNQH